MLIHSYQRSTLSKAVHIDDAIIDITTQVNVIFGKFGGHFRERNGIRRDTWLEAYADAFICMIDIDSIPTLCLRLDHFHFIS